MCEKERNSTSRPRLEPRDGDRCDTVIRATRVARNGVIGRVSSLGAVVQNFPVPRHGDPALSDVDFQVVSLPNHHVLRRLAAPIGAPGNIEPLISMAFGCSIRMQSNPRQPLLITITAFEDIMPTAWQRVDLNVLTIKSADHQNRE